MKIVFFVHCFFPNHFYGTETYTLELAKNYKIMGFDVHVVSGIFTGEAAAPETISHYTFQDIPVTIIDKNKLPNSRVKDTYYQVEMRPILEQVLKTIKPDIVHVTHLINHTAALLEVTSELGIPTFATFTDFYGFCFNNKLEASNGSLCSGPSRSRNNCIACYIKDANYIESDNKLLQWLIKKGQFHRAAQLSNLLRKHPNLRHGSFDGLIEDLIRRPDTLLSLYSTYKTVIAPTQFLYSAYKNNGFLNPMQKISFGVDINRNSKSEKEKDTKPIFGYIGQIAPHKGVDILINAFCRLPRGSAELRIYGPKDQDAEYMETLFTKAKGHNIHFLGVFEKNKMEEIFNHLDLCIIPSRWYENSPLVLLNSLATHTPVVVSDVAGMTEFVDVGTNGYVFERGSVDDLERVLKKIIKNKDNLKELSLKTNYFNTTKAMAEKTIEVYDAIL